MPILDYLLNLSQNLREFYKYFIFAKEESSRVTPVSKFYMLWIDLKIFWASFFFLFLAFIGHIFRDIHPLWIFSRERVTTHVS